MKKLIYLSLLLTLFSCTKEKLSDVIQVNINDVLTKQTWIVTYNTYYGAELTEGNIVNFFPSGDFISYTPWSNIPNSSNYQIWSAKNNIVTFSISGYNYNSSISIRSWTVTIKSDTEIWFDLIPNSYGKTYQVRLRKS